MPRNEEIVGRFLGCSFIFDNGEDKPIVIIADIDTEHGQITIKGEADPKRELAIGMVYRFGGHFKEHWKHGRQFCFSSFTAEEPADEEAIIAYLSQCEGIGKVTACCLWEEFQADAVKVLREDPERACENIPRFSPEKARLASAQLKGWQRYEKTKLDLLGLLNGRGFPKKTIAKAIEYFGSEAAAAIKANPYLLMKFRGCGFLKTDRMYLELGYCPSKLKRQALCGWYRIASASDGDTWYPERLVIGEIRSKVAGAEANPTRALRLAVRGELLARSVQRGSAWIAEKRKADSEEHLASYIRDALTDTNICAPFLPLVKDILSERFESYEHQYEMLKRACGGEGGISILGGSPGTGKTTSTAAMVKAAIARYGNQFMIAAAAPTGKAAVRFSEALSNNGVGLKACTIHSLLQVESSEDGWSFRHRIGNPLPHKLIFVDEISMADTDIMRSLFAARAVGTHIVLIGDVCQLPPVGHGAPLRDMIAAGVPYGELTEIRRNSGRIVKACAEIRDFNRFTPSPKLDIDNGENLIVKNLSDPGEIVEWIETTVTDQQVSGLNPIWDCQILVPVNKKSPLARKMLNERLQRLLNPNGRKVSGNPFRVGDKVINLKNGQLPLYPKQKIFDENTGKEVEASCYVANGEQGRVIEVEPARTIVRLQAPERTIVIPHGQQPEDDEPAGEDETESKGVAGSWDLAYAISGHKSQGSEWPVVIVVLDSYGGAQRVMSRNWLYTAISRAKKICYLVGSEQVAQAACKRDALSKRKTFLKERITGEFQPPLSEAEIKDLFRLDPNPQLMEA